MVGMQLLEVVNGLRCDWKIVLLEGWTFGKCGVRWMNMWHCARYARKVDAEVAALLHSSSRIRRAVVPDTYHFAKGTSDHSVLRRASARMLEFREQWSMRATDLRLDAVRGADTGLNRGERNCRARTGLRSREFRQSPAQSMKSRRSDRLYGLGENFDGNLRRRDLDTDGPYNTYMRTGLPPTQIARPGLASLAAAVRPEAGTALYFVARVRRIESFSESLAEHNRAVTNISGKQATGR